MQGVFVKFGSKYPSNENSTVVKHLIGGRKAIIAYIREYAQSQRRGVEKIWRNDAKVEYWYSQRV